MDVADNLEMHLSHTPQSSSAPSSQTTASTRTPTPSPSKKQPQHSPTRRPPASNSWADIVVEGGQGGKERRKKCNKKQRLDQIMNWPKPKPKSRSGPNSSLKLADAEHYQRKDGEKEASHSDASCSSTGSSSCDTQCDTHSCDSFSTTTSSYDSMSSDTLSCKSNESNEERKKRKRKKGKRNYSAKEEGRKVFVGKIQFEDCDSSLSRDNTTLADFRHSKFEQMFYLFGVVSRVQGHWDEGYSFVVFANRKAAKLAVKCMAMAPVRKRVVENMRDNIAPTGVLPLPTFYVRWPTSRKDEKTKNTGNEQEKQLEDSEDEGMDWMNEVKEEDMGEEQVDRLMKELLTLRE